MPAFGPHWYKANGQWYLGTSPSKKSVLRLKTTVGNLLVPGNNAPWQEVRDTLNWLMSTRHRRKPNPAAPEIRKLAKEIPSSANGADSPLRDVRLAGVVIGPDLRMAIFAVTGTNSRVLSEGETLKGWVFGLGAYTAGLFAIHLSPDLLLGHLAAISVAALVGALTGAMILHTGGVTLLMLTLAIVSVLSQFANQATDLTGGAPLPVSAPRGASRRPVSRSEHGTPQPSLGLGPRVLLPSLFDGRENGPAGRLEARAIGADFAAQHDPVVATSIANVQNLLAPPPSLLRPQIALRVWKSARRSPYSSAELHAH